MSTRIILAAILSTWNIAVFLIYATDKCRAKANGRRISDKTLLICAFLFGAFGALLGMLKTRHKTRRVKFQILIPLALLLQIIALTGLYLLFSRQ